MVAKPWEVISSEQERLYGIFNIRTDRARLVLSRQLPPMSAGFRLVSPRSDCPLTIA